MSRPRRVALASSSSLPDWEKDDEPLVAALEARGLEVTSPAWDSPNEDWARYDACLIRTTWDYQERLDEFLAWVDRVSCSTTLLNPAPVLQWNIRKSYLRDLEAKGARCIPTAWLPCGEPARLQELVRDAGWERGFVKPVVGANARATYRFTSDATDLARVQIELDRLLLTESMMLQPYLDSVESKGEASMIFFDGEFSHGVRKIPKSGDYRVQDDWGASDAPWQPSPAEVADAARILEFVQESSSSIESLLYVRLDFLFLPDGQLALNEAEAIEPSLFFRHSTAAAERLASALHRRIAT